MRARRAAGWCLPAVLLLSVITEPAWAGDWPRFRGPNGSGVAADSELPRSFGPVQNRVWAVDVPPGFSSPIISGDSLFLTAVEDEKLFTLRYDRNTGAELWRRECPRPRKETLDRRNHAAAASVAVEGANVYVFFGDFGLISYDFDGKERWRLPLGPFDNTYGMGASPIVVDGFVVLLCDQRSGSFIVAADKDTGKVRWKRDRPDAISGHSTPVVYETDAGKKQILAPGSFRMDAYAVETGKSEWWVYGLASEMKSVPVVGPGLVYVAGYNVPENDAGQQIEVPPFAKALAEYDANGNKQVSRDELPEGRLRKFVGFSDGNKDGELNEAEWRTYAAAQASENGLRAIRPGGQGDTTATSLAWKQQRGIPQLPSPLLYEGILYLINDGGRLTLFDAETGDIIKQLRLRGALDNYYASPVAGGGHVYFTSLTGYVTVLRAGRKPSILTVNKLDDAVYATPAIADGHIYLRTASRLYCFGEK